MISLHITRTLFMHGEKMTDSVQEHSIVISNILILNLLNLTHLFEYVPAYRTRPRPIAILDTTSTENQKKKRSSR